MQIKKFEAPTIQEALDAIKRELGPEAIILQTKRNKRGFGLLNGASFEVTAAVTDQTLEKRKQVEKSMRQAAGVRIDPSGSVQATEQVSNLTRQPRYASIDDPQMQVSRPAPRPEPRRVEVKNDPAKLADEVKLLKKMIQELQENRESQLAEPQVGSSWLQDAPHMIDLFEQLVLKGMERRIAYKYLKIVSFELGEGPKSPEAVLDQLASELLQEIKTVDLLADIVNHRLERTEPKAIVLAGPTGVGKTTTLAKISAEALKKNLSIGLINLDHYRLGASEQFATYAKLLGVPYRHLTEVEQWKDIAVDFKGLDLVLIDTTGRSQRDYESIQELQKSLAHCPFETRIHLALASATRENEITEVMKGFSILKPQSILFTKLDEVQSHGFLMNALERTKLPASYFTTGQRVPEDLELASAERIVSLLLEI